MTTRTMTADLLVFPSRPVDRLRRAMRKLEAAVAEQNEAVAGFRSNLSALSQVVAGLDASMRGYRDRLNDAAGATRDAHMAATRLSATADAMLVRK